MRFVIPLLVCLLSALPLAADGPQPAPTSHRGALRLDEILWREVQNRAGESLGGVSDVLVQMPSGRVMFVAVDPSALFERPKAVPPHALIVPDRPSQPFQLDITTERWIEAPRLDWNAALVIKNTHEGGRIYGYYQQAWRESDPTPPWGMTVVAPPPDAAPAARYVSLKKLLLERVITPATQHVGVVRDFLIDWTQGRATHALVSPRFTPLAQPDAMWLAIPTPLLLPSIEDDALTANTDVETLRQATPLAAGEKLPTGGAARIFRYPATRRGQ